MFTRGRIVLSLPKPYRLEPAYFAGKISKNRLVGKNAGHCIGLLRELQAPRNGLLTQLKLRH